MAALPIRAACERCARLRKKCVWSAGADKCERCENNGAICVARVRGKTGPRTSPNAGASKKSVANSFANATGFDESLLTMIAQLPPGHVGRHMALRYLTHIAALNGSLDTVLALFEEAGVDMSDFKTDGPTAPQPLSLDTTLKWTDMPVNFRSHHDRARAFSEGERDMFCLQFVESTLRLHTSARMQTLFGEEPVLTQAMFSKQFGDVSMSKFIKGWHIVSACAEFGQVRTVVIDNLRMRSGKVVSVYLTLGVVGPRDTIYVLEMVPVEPAPVAAASVEPSSAPLQWSLPEEDIRILQNMFE